MNSLKTRILPLLSLACAWSLSTPLAAEDFRVLVFTKTAGFVHPSIPDGVALVEALGTANGFLVDVTDDATQFNASNLAQYEAVIWLSTTGDVLNGTQQTAFEDYIRAGGGYVGIHSASDTENAWGWYGGLLGNNAYFSSHPAVQNASLDVADAGHSSTQSLPAGFQLTDEWYDFANDPTPFVNVVLTVDEGSYSGAQMGLGANHPITWYHEYDGGRAWYTALGHTTSTYNDPVFGEHLLGGIRWAALGVGLSVPASAIPRVCGASVGDFTHVGSDCDADGLPDAGVAGPVIGESWLTNVAIQSGDAASLVFVASDPAPGIPLGGIFAGSSLCCLSLLDSPSVSATGVHGISIPNDASLVGNTYCSQAASLRLGNLRLTLLNAIDLTIGAR